MNVKPRALAALFPLLSLALAVSGGGPGAAAQQACAVGGSDEPLEVGLVQI